MHIELRNRQFFSSTCLVVAFLGSFCLFFPLTLLTLLWLVGSLNRMNCFYFFTLHMKRNCFIYWDYTFKWLFLLKYYMSRVVKLNIENLKYRSCPKSTKILFRTKCMHASQPCSCLLAPKSEWLLKKNYFLGKPNSELLRSWYLLVCYTHPNLSYEFTT